MSLLAEDASEIEGAFKKKEYHNPVSRHKKDENEDKDSALPSAKSGWGNEEGGVVPKKKDEEGMLLDFWFETNGKYFRANATFKEGFEPAEVGDYNWDSDDEAESVANATKAEEASEELVSTVAEAPKHVAMMQTIKELDKNIKFSLPSQEGLDFSILMSVLDPYAQVVEKDVTWEFDSLFVKISAEVQAEYESKEKETEEKEKEKEEIEDSGAQPGRA